MAVPVATAAEPVLRVERVSVAADGTQGDGDSRAPSVRADGRYVAFESDATNLVPGTGMGAPVYDRHARVAAFQSRKKDWVRGDTNLRGDVFLVRLR
ncbi:hypothetical protein [Streptomyces sp. NPDC046197]|uniref:hypothetical protein n=1 Tax=Streptomyces sp. NPDC046197 TaxID=3154337 RepID=UPI0033E2899D